MEQVSKTKSSLSAFEGKKIVVSGVFENYSRETIKDEIIKGFKNNVYTEDAYVQITHSGLKHTSIFNDYFF